MTTSQEEKVKVKLISTPCPRCKQNAGPEAKFCPSCGMILDVKTAVSVEEDRAKADQIMDMLMKDEEVRNLLAKKIHGLYSSSQLPPTS